jgi:hypothetical protein
MLLIDPKPAEDGGGIEVHVIRREVEDVERRGVECGNC